MPHSLHRGIQGAWCSRNMKGTRCPPESTIVPNVIPVSPFFGRVGERKDTSTWLRFSVSVTVSPYIGSYERPHLIIHPLRSSLLFLPLFLHLFQYCGHIDVARNEEQIGTTSSQTNVS